MTTLVSSLKDLIEHYLKRTVQLLYWPDRDRITLVLDFEPAERRKLLIEYWCDDAWEKRTQ